MHYSREKTSGVVRVAIVLSLLAHFLITGIIFGVALLKQKPVTDVPIFEMVQLEKPKLQPLRPKVEKPKPKVEKKEVVKKAPKLTEKPEPKPKPVEEPKVARKDPDTTEKKEEVVEQTPLEPKQVLHVDSDPRLKFWTRNMKRKVELLWNPPSGIDIFEPTKVRVSFVVLRDGTIEQIQIADPSGKKVLDEVALRTIQRVGKAIPIPPNYPEDQLRVGYEFVYGADL